MAAMNDMRSLRAFKLRTGPVAAWTCILLAKASLTLAFARQVRLLATGEPTTAWLLGAVLLVAGIGLLIQQETA